MGQGRQGSPRERAITIARAREIARTRNFDMAGIPRTYLNRLYEEGQLLSIARGLYQLADAEWSESHSLAEATRVVPHGVICLLSALRFHELTTQLPHQVWMLIGHKKWAPRNPPVSLHVVRATGESLTAGIDLHSIGQVHVPITTPAKSVAGCFKYRSRVGLDVAIERPRDCPKTNGPPRSMISGTLQKLIAWRMSCGYISRLWSGGATKK